MILNERIDAAIERITSGQAGMRIPAEETDPDLVLADCKAELERLKGALSNAVHSLDDFKARAFRLERERDEARAEAERLRQDWRDLAAYLSTKFEPDFMEMKQAVDDFGAANRKIGAEQAEAKLATVVETLKTADEGLELVLSCGLPPHDVSGQAMWQGARDAWTATRRALAAAKEKP
jgi:chromosome segregation ATPase